MRRFESAGERRGRRPFEVYRRLRATRATYDPDDRFCANHPVPAC